MATETLYATGTPTSTGNCTNPANAHAAANNVWAGPTGTNSDWTHRWSMGDPTQNLTTATQTITVTARKNGTGGNDPTLTINLWENGSLVSSIGSATVTNTTSQSVVGTFAGSVITNKNNVEIELVSNHGGGSPGGRYEVQVDAITWTANVQDPPVTINPVGPTSASSSDTAQLTVSAAPANIQGVESTSTTSSDTAQLTATYLPMTVNPVESSSTTSSDTAQLTVSQPPMAVTFSYAETGDYVNVNLTPAAPSGTGGVLVAVVVKRDGTYSPNTPGDWVNSGAPAGGGESSPGGMWYSTAADPDMQFNNSNESSDWGVYVWRVPDADTTNPRVSWAAYDATTNSTFTLDTNWDKTPARGTALLAAGIQAGQQIASTSKGFTVDLDTPLSWWATDASFAHLEDADLNDLGTVTLTGLIDYFSAYSIFVKRADNVVATDDFNRANESLTASSDWAWLGAGFDTAAIVSNVVQSTGADNGAYWQADTFSADQWVEADISVAGSTGGGAVLWARRTANNETYAAEWQVNGTVTLFNVTSASGWTSIGSSTGHGTSGKFRLEVVGTQITAYVDGVEVVTQSNSTHTTGRTGFHTYHSSGTAPTLDNYSAGDWRGPQNVVATDDFNRANETLQTSSNWATPTGTGTWNIVSNAVQATSTGDKEGRWTTPMGTGDHWAEMDLQISSGGGAELVVRADDTSTNATGYTGFWNEAAGGTYGLWDQWSDTQLGSSVTGVGISGTRKMRLEVIGSTLTLYVDGVEEVSVGTAAHTSSQYVGFQGGYSTVTPTIDNFSAGNWSPQAQAVTIDPIETVSTTSSDIAALTSPGTPVAITDLAGVGGLSAGTVDLTWTEPVGVQ